MSPWCSCAARSATIPPTRAAIGVRPWSATARGAPSAGRLPGRRCGISGTKGPRRPTASWRRSTRTRRRKNQKRKKDIVKSAPRRKPPGGTQPRRRDDVQGTAETKQHRELGKSLPARPGGRQHGDDAFGGVPSGGNGRGHAPWAQAAHLLKDARGARHRRHVVHPLSFLLRTKSFFRNRSRVNFPSGDWPG